MGMTLLWTESTGNGMAGNFYLRYTDLVRIAAGASLFPKWF